ncbi:hypothetical protein KIPB_005230 [Kipferlia bialata]|uniref:Uncharacterized protein n=1 Tax=Kipferlia bialata TaxID=797122 RepID=A0A9K3CWQ3_9EUKA|nr:hypothetical protein KIPB_005230 [Kipferlia bialata]|eukprot:g5230.t1
MRETPTLSVTWSRMMATTENPITDEVLYDKYDSVLRQYLLGWIRRGNRVYGEIESRGVRSFREKYEKQILAKGYITKEELADYNFLVSLFGHHLSFDTPWKQDLAHYRQFVPLRPLLRETLDDMIACGLDDWGR